MDAAARQPDDHLRRPPIGSSVEPGQWAFVSPRERPMRQSPTTALFWAPRVLCILFAVFLSMFALDVFSEGYGIGETILALLLHLIPVLLVAIALMIAWRWAAVGAFTFIAIALLYVVSSRGESWIVSVPLFLVGVLFLLDWRYGTNRRVRRTRR